MIHLRKYTNLPVLFDILVNRKLSFLDPRSWEDRNDSFYLEKYREIKKLKTVLTICFTSRQETFHHWKVFAGNPGGVCIRFNKDKLLDYFNKYSGIRTGFVNYKFIHELKNNLPLIEELPFIKRKQYIDEAEFRIIYENANRIYKIKDIKIDLLIIDRITLSPWLPQGISKTVKDIIHQIPGCKSIELIKTGVIENEAWKNIANRLV